MKTPDERELEHYQALAAAPSVDEADERYGRYAGRWVNIKGLCPHFNLMRTSLTTAYCHDCITKVSR